MKQQLLIFFYHPRLGPFSGALLADFGLRSICSPCYRLEAIRGGV